MTTNYLQTLPKFRVIAYERLGHFIGYQAQICRCKGLTDNKDHWANLGKRAPSEDRAVAEIYRYLQKESERYVTVVDPQGVVDILRKRYKVNPKYLTDLLGEDDD